MARADLLKQLFKAYRNSDREQFMDAARSIVEEERRKNHSILANELMRILNNGVAVMTPVLTAALQPPPRDQERKTPLIEVRQPSRLLRELVLKESQVDVIKRSIREFREWDVLESNGLKPSHKLLFCGPPGCGKTVTAEAIASDISLPLLYVRFDAVVSSLLGETAANLRKVFDYASQESWVILFDEFDAIGRSRDDITEHGEIKRVVNSFLQMLDNFQGRSIVIAATNFEQALDPALWRRFDEIIRFERPTIPQIKQLIEIRLRPLSGNKERLGIYAKRLEGASFGDVERVCLEVMKTCALEGRSRFERKDMDIAIEHQELRKQVLENARPVDGPRVDQS